MHKISDKRKTTGLTERMKQLKGKGMLNRKKQVDPHGRARGTVMLQDVNM